jgi:integrase
MVGAIVRIAMLTGMRCGEILSLRWGQIDFEKQVLTVGRAKTVAGTGRQIPLNLALLSVLTAHASWYLHDFQKTLELRPEWYLFPFGSPTPQDPLRHVQDIKTAWGKLRREAKVRCRFHDLRHTLATKLAENGVPESTMLAILGHMSRQMLERYSHIRMAAKRDAMQGIVLAQGEEQVLDQVFEVGVVSRVVS